MRNHTMATSRKMNHGMFLSRVLGSVFLVVLLTAIAAEESLPSAPLPLLEGGTLQLRSLAGQVVVVRFLASW